MRRKVDSHLCNIKVSCTFCFSSHIFYIPVYTCFPEDRNIDGGGGGWQWKRSPRSKYGRSNHPRKVHEWEEFVGSRGGSSQGVGIILRGAGAVLTTGIPKDETPLILSWRWCWCPAWSHLCLFSRWQEFSPACDEDEEGNHAPHPTWGPQSLCSAANHWHWTKSLLTKQTGKTHEWEKLGTLSEISLESWFRILLCMNSGLVSEHYAWNLSGFITVSVEGYVWQSRKQTKLNKSSLTLWWHNSTVLSRISASLASRLLNSVVNSFTLRV